MFSFFFSLVCIYVALFLPCFHTFKVIAKRPIDEAELERVAKYWSVISCVFAVEYLAEWAVSWLPFYYELKTAFLLFLSLPQTQGSTFIYDNYLQPFFSKNEAAIDSGIVSIQASFISFVQTRMTLLWDLVISVINKQPTTGQPPSAGASQSSPPTLMGLWNTYGPTLVSALQPVSKPPTAVSPGTPSEPATPPVEPAAH